MNKVKDDGKKLKELSGGRKYEMYTFDSVVAQAPESQGTRERARLFAGKDVPVLILGESGTGKEVYAQAIQPGTGEPCNRILLSGALCKPPVFRRTPLGRSICDLMLAVSRRYGRADYLPVIAWGQLAARCGTLQVGDGLFLEGRVQSRAYKKVTDAGTQDRVAYEVSMMHLLEDEEAYQ